MVVVGETALQLNKVLEVVMTVVEALLVIGTFGICTGVWVTLAVIISQNKRAFKATLKNARPVAEIVKSYKLKESK